MFNKAEIEFCVDMQRRSYLLLRWSVEAIDRGFLSFEAIHSYSRFSESADAWIREHYSNLPEDARPPRERIGEFANFFSTYLETSFDIVEDPGKQLYSPQNHCYCPWCSWLIDAPRLRTKKLKTIDKRRAHALTLDFLMLLALENDRDLDVKLATKLIESEDTREAAALGAYAQELLNRLRGKSSGPATLVLWRTFAWTIHGSPKSGFELSTEMILRAEKTCSEKM